MRDVTRALLDPVCQKGRARDVLDAGCGTGGMMGWLEPYAAGGRVAGVDLSADALAFRPGPRPGGVSFVRVAAYEWMRSGHDEALGTQRRYTLGLLTERMERAGFRVVRTTYANALLLPAAAGRRLALKPLGLADAGSDVKPLPAGLGWLNRVFTSALSAEAGLLRRFG